MNTHYRSLGYFLLLVFMIALLGGMATHQSLDPWYKQLLKPSWTPPAWVFGPVWTTLYMMIGFSGWLLFIAERTEARTRALLFYFVQLFFNGAWSFLFFYFQNPFLGFIDIILLVISLILCIRSSWIVSKKAAYLLIPYLLWILYATSLNGGILYANY